MWSASVGSGAAHILTCSSIASYENTLISPSIKSHLLPISHTRSHGRVYGVGISVERKMAFQLFYRIRS